MTAEPYIDGWAGRCITAPPIMPAGETPWLHQFFTDLYARSAFHRAHQAGTVYCFTEGHGMPVKLGYSSNFAVRYQAMQLSTWRPLYVCWSIEGATIAHESALKHLLRDAMVRGEWFRDQDDTLKFCMPVSGGKLADLEAIIEARAKAQGYPSNRYPRRARSYGETLVLSRNGAAA